VENLEVVLPHAATLIERLEGKTVLSSDHGHEFGGRGFPIPVVIYAHPENLRTTNLAKVRWIVFESDKRKRIRSGTITTTDSVDEDEVTDRLRHLGYH
jgi:hypothetical protein